MISNPLRKTTSTTDVEMASQNQGLSTSSLHINNATEPQPQSLFEYMTKDAFSLSFLRLTLLIWPKLSCSPPRSMMVAAIFIAFLVCLGGFVIFFSFLAIVEATYLLIFFDNLTITWLFYCAGILTILCTVLSLAITGQNYIKANRLMKEPLQTTSIPHIHSAISISFSFISISCIVIFLGIFIGMGTKGSLIAFSAIINQWFTASGLVLSLFFVIIDARTCCDELEAISSLLGMQQLSLEKYVEFSETIRRRVDEKSSTLNTTIAVAVANGIFFVFNTAAIRNVALHATGGNSGALGVGLVSPIRYIVGNLLVDIAAGLKEVVYVIIVLFEVSRVNDKADALYLQLSKRAWAAEDYVRVQLFVHYSGQPISYDLLGYRMTRSMVYFQIFGYVLSVCIALLEGLLNPELFGNQPSGR